MEGESDMPYKKRITKARELLSKLGLKSVVVTYPSNFFYFSGTWIDSHERLQAIVIPETGEPTMIIHEMSKEEIKIKGLYQTVFWKDGEKSLEHLLKILPDRGTVAIDNLWPSQNLIQLMNLNEQLSFVDSTEVIGSLRLYKDKEEIDLLKKSGAIADKVLNEVIGYIRPGLTEKEVSEEIKRLFALNNVDQLSFKPIIGAGKNGAIPHHQSGDNIIKTGDMVVIDMGGVKDHYCSDMTRTVYVGEEPTEEMKKVYQTVKMAKDEAIKAVKPGVPLKQIDKVARNIISEAGYGDYFTHRTGHGLGIDVHEEPYVTFNNSQLLEEGMVISIEPGIYLSGNFGVRIEDIVVVTSDGCERLNNLSCDLICTGKHAQVNR
ncbi:M24 family metallopeptidase [Bacillus sp. FJAT-29937]|uniref:M24 family metallopeptidase n=1 Tax=Bacillus sp. FJAT-29937 TaxID=1720553 RepID=UPI001E63D92E|nr:Xaa-Pro peptidase family protein [Bacillus sp. FJAT-29937]